MISITIDGTEYKVKKGITILAASFETQKLAQEPFQVKIPTLYYLKNVMDIDESGVCVVEVDGKLVNACLLYTSYTQPVHTGRTC